MVSAQTLGACGILECVHEVCVTTEWHGTGMRAWRAGYVHTLVTTSQLPISRWLKHHKVSHSPTYTIYLLTESCMVGAHNAVTCPSLYGMTLVCNPGPLVMVLPVTWSVLVIQRKCLHPSWGLSQHCMR